MFALQKALRDAKPAWLHIGGLLRDGEMPWFWCWEDRLAACACAEVNMPFVIGPNMLFMDRAKPCTVASERELCNAGSCRLQFTESAWYRDLIFAHSGPAMRAPIVLWPYPIDPMPGGPLSHKHDLLVYEKSGFGRELLCQLLRRWPALVRVRYGQFQRERLIELARQSRACVYISEDDRGPLALAEILLSGCPAVGTPHGAPWIESGRTGYHVETFDFASLRGAIERALQLDRFAVRTVAQERFNTDAIVQTILAALDRASKKPAGGQSGIGRQRAHTTGHYLTPHVVSLSKRRRRGSRTKSS
jgi:hypothetical protein